MPPPQDKEPTINIPIKVPLLWLIAAIAGSVGGVSIIRNDAHPAPAQISPSIESRLNLLEWRMGKLEGDCAKK